MLVKVKNVFKGDVLSTKVVSFSEAMSETAEALKESPDRVVYMVNGTDLNQGWYLDIVDGWDNEIYTKDFEPVID